MVMFRHILNIFHALNYQDFPEYFEDNLKTWIQILKSGVEFNFPISQGDNLFLQGIVRLKTTVMKCVNLYCNNYYEDILDYHAEFYPHVWNLVQFVKNEETYSKLVRELLDYYKILFQYSRNSGFSSETIQHLINNLIIPNMRMTLKELDEFEENPINFLKVELEEADMDSSKFIYNNYILDKYHAINLLKNLINIYPNVTSEFIRPLINQLLENYHTNPMKNWMDKVVAINLIFATMIKTFAQRSK
jgi:exportin-2 (importin alpha re-exporter)